MKNKYILLYINSTLGLSVLYNNASRPATCECRHFTQTWKTILNCSYSVVFFAFKYYFNPKRPNSVT
jgi:hypothetical protein